MVCRGEGTIGNAGRIRKVDPQGPHFSCVRAIVLLQSPTICHKSPCAAVGRHAGGRAHRIASLSPPSGANLPPIFSRSHSDTPRVRKIRNPKHEIRNNLKTPKKKYQKNDERANTTFMFSAFYCFWIYSDFELRISDFHL